MGARGEVALALDGEALRRIAATIREEGVEAVAVCFLHSYAYGQHEEEAGRILSEAAPEVSVSLSSEIAPEFREYARASTTVINAALRPGVGDYLERVERGLSEVGVSGELLVMQSSGGVYGVRTAQERPVFMVESGPAAGTIAASHIGREAGYDDVLSFDMGGTTAKVGLIEHGTPQITKDYEVGAAAGAGLGDRRGSGYPIRAPVIDLVEIGAGGGSIAWIDSGGMLRVGPASAGAAPGPACYGRGGDQPTVTDANLVLGRLNPSYFLGGEITLDADAARRAIERCAEALGMDVMRTAYSIVEIANTAMINALRMVTVQRGHDPRDFALVAFGGAGPVHANRLAEANEIGTTIIPRSPGTASALGLLATDLTQEYSTTLLQRCDEIDLLRLHAGYRTLEDRADADLAAHGVPEEQRRIAHQVDMRYVGQSYELTLEAPDDIESPEFIERISGMFHVEHDRVFGFSAPGETIELVNLRVIGIGMIQNKAFSVPAAAETSLEAAESDRRPVVFDADVGAVDCPIYDRYKLPYGARILGPAVVEEIDSTTVIHDGYSALVNDYGHLILSSV
jgi:N-methylhydantoinase A